MQTWQRIVNATSPVSLKHVSELFEIRSCYLTTGDSSTLYCTALGQETFSVVSLSKSAPYTIAKVRLPSDSVLTCSNGELVVAGVVRSIAEGRSRVKKARTSTARSLHHAESSSCEPLNKIARIDSTVKSINHDKRQGDVDLQERKAASSTPIAQITHQIANATVDTDMHQDDSDLQDRRAALRRANAQTTERNNIVAAKLAAEKLAADKRAEDRAAAREAEREAERNKIMDAKRRMKEKEHSESERGNTASGKRALRAGLTYDLIKVGLGSAAAYGKKVSVRYEGRLARNGKVFDRGTLRFSLGKGEVIRGWDEGVKGMRVGEQRKLYIPAHLGYGKSGAPPKIPANADLIFVVTRMQS